MSSAGEPLDLSGKVVVVTGGSRGIGRALSQGFAAAGAHVVVASRKLEACEAVAREAGATRGRRALAAAFHVGRWEDCGALADRVYGEFGRCDVLVNNAGMSPAYDGLAEVTEDYWDKVTAVNLKGPFRLSALFATRMAAGEGGNVINISSVGSLRPSAGELVYACAKAGLNALTIGLAEAYGPKVRANGILPGAVITDVSAHWGPDVLERVSRCPMGRAGQPEDLVGAALWLASPAAAWITGVLLRVDGGAYRQMS